MSVRPRLIRSIPFWVLLIGSIASAALGIWLVLDKIGTMTSTITDGSATGVEVYAGQAWVTVGAGLLTAGLIGLVLVLTLAVVRSFLPAAVVEEIEIAASDDFDEDLDTLPAAAPAAAAPFTDTDTVVEVDDADGRIVGYEPAPRTQTDAGETTGAR
ncbi:hypothetical protein ACFM35_06775 [Microbacterium sp. P01]|uniref:hypothetical protein n=1 Tax=unclassified Microbacterium TaxID=2609290 RepID=UPI003671FE9A